MPAPDGPTRPIFSPGPDVQVQTLDHAAALAVVEGAHPRSAPRHASTRSLAPAARPARCAAAGDGLHAILHLADVLEDAVDHPHDPAGHVVDADHQPGGQGDGAHRDQRLAPQPQGQAGGAGDQQAVEHRDGHVHGGHHAPGLLGLEGLVADGFAGVVLFLAGVGEQLQGGDVGVAVDDPPHQLRARIRGHHRAVLDLGNEVGEGADVGDHPQQQRDHQAPVGLGEQHQGADGIDHHVPEGIHHLHRRIAQRVAGLHDALGDAPGEIVLEEAEALLEHVAVVLPADQVGHAGVDALVHQHVVQGVEQRAQDQRHHRHPDQFVGVHAEELRAGRALGEIDDAAEVAEQRHLDQRHDQADHQQGEEHRPDLAQIIEVKRPHSGGWGIGGGILKNIDKTFKTTIQHKATLSDR